MRTLFPFYCPFSSFFLFSSSFCLYLLSIHLFALTGLINSTCSLTMTGTSCCRISRNLTVSNRKLLNLQTHMGCRMSRNFKNFLPPPPPPPPPHNWFMANYFELLLKLYNVAIIDMPLKWCKQNCPITCDISKKWSVVLSVFLILFSIFPQCRKVNESYSTLTVLSTAPENILPLETARQATLPWCLTNVWEQIMLSMLQAWKKKHIMWFPTMWHFDKCKLRQACAASFIA